MIDMAKPAKNAIVCLHAVPDAFDFHESCAVHDFVVTLEGDLSQRHLMSAADNPYRESRE